MLTDAFLCLLQHHLENLLIRHFLSDFVAQILVSLSALGTINLLNFLI